MIAALSTKTQSFGFIGGTTGGNYNNLFDVSGTGTGVTGSSGPVNIGSPFRFAQNSEGSIFSSSPLDTPDGRDHMLTYEVTGTPGQTSAQRKFVLFFEDTNSSVSDFDYNDLVVEVTTGVF